MSGVSIKDIAKAAGVSHSTVSRALHNSTLISADTRERIQALAKHMGYTPDTIARSLVTGRTHTLGVVVTSIADPFIGGIVQIIDTEASRMGYTVILATSSSLPEREMEAVRMLGEKRVDGVIVTSSRVGSLYADMLDQLGIPIVLINTHAESDTQYTYSVTIDNKHGGYTATNHLIALGHQRIAYVSGSEHHSDDAGRVAGYCQALAEHGLVADPSLVLPGNGTAESGVKAMNQICSLNNRPSAVFCYNDTTAIGLLSRARELGLRVPENLSVVGFDDITISSLVWPTLTTIAQPFEQMGSCAVDMVLKLLQQGSENHVRDQILQGTLIDRLSTHRCA